MKCNVKGCNNELLYPKVWRICTDHINEYRKSNYTSDKYWKWKDD